jgi:tRNA-Thr(GGU) m(6)t(6)A37 methyltransferase TsaA
LLSDAKMFSVFFCALVYQEEIHRMKTGTDNTLSYIGRVRSTLKNLEDCPLQESEQAPAAAIEISNDFVAGIRSLKPGDRVVLLTWLHEADRSVIECYPRNQVNAPTLGVFATRSPNRPNPIGIHQVTITSIEKNILTVDALEALDGTPVVDIKPVI